MKIPVRCVLAALALIVLPAAAQDLDTSQLEQSADNERNRILVRSTMRQKPAYDAKRRDVTVRQVQACADKARFRTRHGANDPRVQLLFRKCRAVGL